MRVLGKQIRFGSYLLLAGAILALPTALPSAPATVDGGSAVSHNHQPDQILVRFKPGTPKAVVDNSHGPVPPTNAHAYQLLDGLKLFTLPPGQDVLSAIEHYKKNPNVLYAEPDNIVQLNATNDPSFSKLWGLNNTGQSVNGTSGTNDADMNVVEAWANTSTTGDSGVVIAVIDTGVQYDHPDLAANMWTNPGETPANGIDDDGNGYIDDVYGINAITNSGNPMDDNNHGTHVAGTIAAVGDNSVGLTGVMQSAKILACKFLAASGSGKDSDALKCLDYIYDLKMRGINIVVSNNSWGSNGGGSQSVSDAIDKHRQAGILFVAAAGNSNLNNDSQPHYPSNYFRSNIISVAATDQSDARASFSNYGNRSVDVGAPGVNIYSSITGNSYAYLQGTSMAAPHVTGLVALLKAQDPSRNWITIKNLIISSGTPVAALSGLTTSGRRVRAWDNNNRGALTCSNQTTAAVVYPQTSNSTKIAGTQLGLAVLNINCAAGAGTVSVTTSGPTSVGTVTLQDDGLGFDQVAGDGIYSGYWTAPATTGTYTLTFANGQTQTVSVIANTSTRQAYRAPVSIAYNPRTSASAFSTMADNSYVSLSGYTAYYNIPFGGVNVSTIYATAKGINMMAAPSVSAHVSGSNTSLANESFETLVAAYWDDLDLTASGYGLRGWWNYNSAATPVGEVVYEWKGKQKSTNNLVQVQIVYSANSSDIEMHYIATDNNADSATVGVQVDWVRAATQSYNFSNSDLAAGKAWKWSLDNGEPSVDAGANQSVAGNALVNLTGTANDPDGGTLSYAWSQVSGTLVTLSGAHTLTPSFYAPNVDGNIVLQLTATDDAGQSKSDTVTVTVTAGAPAGSLQFNNVSYSYNENAGNATITVTRSGGSAGAVSVNYTTADGSASATSDYTYTTGTLSWTDGDTTAKTFNVPITNDNTIESNETVSLSLLNPTGGATLGTSGATLTIVNDDSYGTIAFKNSNYSVNESGPSATITVSRTGGSSGAVSVNYASANGTATAGSDYTAVSSSLNWADGDSTDKSFSITITNDASIEGDETVLLSLSGVSGGATLGTSSATLAIVDNDFPTAGSLGLSATSYSVNENGAKVTITVNRVGGSSGAVSIGYATSNGTASSSSDYTGTSGTLSWADAETTAKTFDVTINDDSFYEGDETFTVSLSGATGGASVGTASATVTIVENESGATGTIALASSSYSVSETGGSVTLSVTRSGGSDGSVSVNYASADNTALDGQDYTAVSGTLTWSNGDSASKTITVNISDDSNAEGSETFSIGLSGIVGATLGGDSATITIIDDETSGSSGNQAPLAVELLSPMDGETGVDGNSVTFEWYSTTDADGDPVSYVLEYCTDADLLNCVGVQVAHAMQQSPQLIAGLGGGMGMGILLFGLVGTNTRRQRLIRAATLIAAALILNACQPVAAPAPGKEIMGQTVTGLQAGTTYYWRVIASDDKGAETPSTTWSFTTL